MIATMTPPSLDRTPPVSERAPEKVITADSRIEDPGGITTKLNEPGPYDRESGGGGSRR